MNEQLKQLQKTTGIKQGQFDNEKNRLYNMGKTLLSAIDAFIKTVENDNMTNEQFFLDWLDKVNEYSVKY